MRPGRRTGQPEPAAQPGREHQTGEDEGSEHRRILTQKCVDETAKSC